MIFNLIASSFAGPMILREVGLPSATIGLSNRAPDPTFHRRKVEGPQSDEVAGPWGIFLGESSFKVFSQQEKLTSSFLVGS